MKRKEGANETISFLNHYLDHFVSSDVKTLHIYSDDSGGQSNNNAVIKLLFLLPIHGRFSTITHHFPEHVCSD
jgi:hypothetical protein